jgi:hypothetical protein
MAHSRDGGLLWVIPPGREAHLAKVVEDELKALKENNFVEGEATARQTFSVDGDGERRLVNHQNV